jgi:hypothetical protein
MVKKLILVILIAVTVGCVFTYLTRCQPKPPTPTVTKKTTATFTTTLTLTATLVPASTTPTATARPTNTQLPTRPTFTPFVYTPTPGPTATKDYCWYNPYFEMFVCYPRLNWHPAP